MLIKPKSRINAVIEVPGSKSYTNRALLVSALAKGKSIIKNPLFSDDTIYMANALKKFGIHIEKKDNSFVVYGDKPKEPNTVIYVGNAGTAMRFLTAFAALVNGKTKITGNPRMQKRPIKDLLLSLEQLGVKTYSNNGYPPVEIIGGNFVGGKTTLEARKSSQYLSAILMVAPYANNDVTIVVKKITSKPYIAITIDVMEKFGVKVVNYGFKRFFIKKQRYVARTYTIEGDASNASYFFAAAAITSGRVKVKNLNPDSVQGDIRFIDILKKMGCKIKKGKNYIEVIGNRLKGIEVDMNDMPDVVQTLAIVALFAHGTTRIRGIENLRIKETDRINAIITELRKVGAEIKFENGLIIKPKPKYKEAIIETYDDHRMAMSFAVLGLKVPITIREPNCVKKSFPDFWEKFKQLYK